MLNEKEGKTNLTNKTKELENKNDSNQKIFWTKLKSSASWKSFFDRIFFIYLWILLIGSFLLALPGFVHKIYSWNFLYSLFNASSAFSDTGLSIPSAKDDYTFWGQLVILLLIQIGGFGVFTFKIMILLLFRQKLKIRDLILAQDERGGVQFGQTVRIIKNSFIFLIVVEIVATLVLFVSFYFYGLKSNSSGNTVTYHHFNNALWSSVFHSVSAINNAGFDIVGFNSLLPYKNNYLIQTIFLLEFVLGGIGFPTLYDLKRTKFGLSKEKKVTLFTKLNLVTYGLISVVGLLLVIVIEYGSGGTSTILCHRSGFNGFWTIFFNTMSTRNAGFSTVNLDDFLPGSKIVHSILMFIGSAPSSTAGGIRTTTFAILVLSVIATIKSQKNINVFKRKISGITVRFSGVVLFTAIILVGLVTLVVSGTNHNLKVINVFYFVCSAFGTTGLNPISIKNMKHIGVVAILLVSILMFIGQLGVSATLLVGNKKWKLHDNFTFPQENIKIS